MDNQATKYKKAEVFRIELELGEISIKDIRFDDKIHMKDGVFYANKEEVGKLALEDDELTGCHVDIAKPGEFVRITPAKNVIEPRVKVSGGEIFPDMIGKVSPQIGTGRTHALEGCCVVTVSKIVGFQEGIIDMSSPAADYCPFSQTHDLCVVMEPADGPETHVYEEAAHTADLKAAAYVGKAARELELDETITYETEPIFERAAMYPDLSRVGYIRTLQSQGLLHDTYYYGVDAKQLIPTFMYPTKVMDGAIVSGNRIASCDKVTTYHHSHDPAVKDCYKHHGKDINFIGVILTDENVFLADKGRHSDMIAKLRNWMRLNSVLITEEGYDNPSTDLMMNYREVEHVGTKVVLIIDELPDKNRKSQSLADVCEEANTPVSCGQGDATLQLPAMDKIIGTQGSVEMQIGGWDGCKNPDSSFEAELQIIIASTIANSFNKPAARGY